jgi:hypothetical protein
VDVGRLGGAKLANARRDAFDAADAELRRLIRDGRRKANSAGRR